MSTMYVVAAPPVAEQLQPWIPKRVAQARIVMEYQGEAIWQLELDDQIELPNAEPLLVGAAVIAGQACCRILWRERWWEPVCHSKQLVLAQFLGRKRGKHGG